MSDAQQILVESLCILEALILIFMGLFCRCLFICIGLICRFARVSDAQQVLIGSLFNFEDFLPYLIGLLKRSLFIFSGSFVGLCG